MIRTLVAVAVFAAVSLPVSADETKPLTTMLLIARAELPDPNFKGSIVLVMNHLATAPAGVILNRPTPIPVSHIFPDLEALGGLDTKVYFGGPVGLQLVSFLFRADKRPEHAVEVVDGVYFSMNRDLLRDLLAREKPMEGLRIFAGYAGWDRGQLEAEIARGDWTLAPADANAIFEGRSPRPWPEPEPAPGAVQRVFGPDCYAHHDCMRWATASPVDRVIGGTFEAAPNALPDEPHRDRH